MFCLLLKVMRVDISKVKRFIEIRCWRVSIFLLFCERSIFVLYGFGVNWVYKTQQSFSLSYGNFRKYLCCSFVEECRALL